MKYQYVLFRKALIRADQKHDLHSLLFKVRLIKKSLKWGFQRCVSYGRLVSTFSSLKKLKLNYLEKIKKFKNIEIMFS